MFDNYTDELLDKYGTFLEHMIDLCNQSLTLIDSDLKDVRTELKTRGLSAKRAETLGYKRDQLVQQHRHFADLRALAEIVYQQVINEAVGRDGKEPAPILRRMRAPRTK